MSDFGLERTPEVMAAIQGAIGEVQRRIDVREDLDPVLLLDVVDGASVVEVFDDVPCDNCDESHPYSLVEQVIHGEQTVAQALARYRRLNRRRRG